MASARVKPLSVFVGGLCCVSEQREQAAPIALDIEDPAADLTSYTQVIY
jgi:hypothetical protein